MASPSALEPFDPAVESVDDYKDLISTVQHWGSTKLNF